MWLKFHINAIVSLTPRFPKWFPCLRCSSFPSCVLYHHWFGQSNNVWWRYSSLWNFLHPSVTSRKTAGSTGHGKCSWGAAVLKFLVSGYRDVTRAAVDHGLSSLSPGCHHGIWWLGCGRISRGRRSDPSWQPGINPRWWLTHVSTNPVPFESWLIHENPVTWRSEVCGSFVLLRAVARGFIPDTRSGTKPGMPNTHMSGEFCEFTLCYFRSLLGCYWRWESSEKGRTFLSLFLSVVV